MEYTAVLELPRIRSLLRHALPNVVEASLVPLVMFYAFLWWAGVWVALFSALVWSYSALAWRLVTGRRVPGLLALGTVVLTARTLIAVLSESAFVYFLQPSLGTILVAGVFLLSVPLGYPMAERLARDFCPLPAAVFEGPHIRRIFTRITFLWAAAHLTNASLAIWLLVSQPVSTYVVAKQTISLAVTATAIGLSTLVFVRSMRHLGVRVCFAAASTGPTSSPSTVGI